MSSSMNKSPIYVGERYSFEEWHSKWEVFRQDHRFNEYQFEIQYPDLPTDRHAMVSMSKEEERALTIRTRKLLLLSEYHLPRHIMLMQ